MDMKKETEANRKKDISKLDEIISKEFTDLQDLSKVDTKVKNWLTTGVYALNYCMSKNLYGGIPSGRVTAIDGKSGTGKSLLSAKAMSDPQVDLIILIDVEGGGNGAELLEFAGVDPKKVRRLTANTFTSYKIVKKTGAIEEIKDNELPSKKLETEKFYYVEGITSKIRRLIQSVMINKIDSNILLIIDSLANIQSVRGLSGTQDVGKRSQDINSFFKNFDVEFEKSNISLIFTNKLYTMLDGTGRMVASGGQAAVYNPSITVRLTDISSTDDLSEAQLRKVSESRRTAFGRTIRLVRATVIKSRFGTEYRNVTFLIDMGYGPIKLSGLFGLCYEFGIIKKTSGAWFEMPGIFDSKFYKKNFIPMVMKDEENIIKKIQKKLEQAEKKLRIERSHFQIDVSEELKDNESLEAEEKEIEASEEFSDMKKEMQKEIDI